MRKKIKYQRRKEWEEEGGVENMNKAMYMG